MLRKCTSRIHDKNRLLLTISGHFCIFYACTNYEGCTGTHLHSLSFFEATLASQPHIYAINASILVGMYIAGTLCLIISKTERPACTTFYMQQPATRVCEGSAQLHQLHRTCACRGGAGCKPLNHDILRHLILVRPRPAMTPVLAGDKLNS